MDGTNGKIRLLIVDDSIFFRKALTEALNGDPRIQVIGTAVDAMDAMEKIKILKPDVATLDVEMPKLNGIDFLRKLMPVNPLPVVVVSSAPIRVLDALSAGAVEFVRKPELKGPGGAFPPRRRLPPEPPHGPAWPSAGPLQGRPPSLPLELPPGAPRPSWRWFGTCRPIPPAWSLSSICPRSLPRCTPSVWTASAT